MVTVSRIKILSAAFLMLFIAQGYCNASMDYILASDIHDSWAVRHIHRLLANNMGPDAEPVAAFRPDDSLTRGELAVMITRVLENKLQPGSGYTEEYHAVKYYRNHAPSTFGDFQFKDWFGYVERVTDRGIMEPVKGHFNPREVISRGEFLKILLKLLTEVKNPEFRMANIASTAEKLNAHMTRFVDVSTMPEQYPGWVKVAQDEAILPELGKNQTSCGWSSDWGIDYSREFYNKRSRIYEFSQNSPVSRALASAIFSNLFSKWDIYSRYIPFDRRVGNSTRDLEARAMSENTLVSARLESVSENEGVFWINGEKRIQSAIGNSIFKTSYSSCMMPVKIDSRAAVWFHAGEWYLVEGPHQAEKIAALMAKLEGPQVEGWRINVIYKPEEYRYDSHQKAVVTGPDGQATEAPVASYVEVIASLYEYHGRITAIRDSRIELMDPDRGRVVVAVSPETKIERVIVNEQGLPEGSVPADSMLNPSNKDIYSNALMALRPGEQILVKTSEDSNLAIRISSKLLRLGGVSNVEVAKRQIRPQSVMDEHYVCDDVDWRPHSASGLLTWFFTGNNWDNSYWQKGELATLLGSGTRLRDVELYVQPATARRMGFNDVPKGRDKLFFVAAVQK